MWNRRQFTAASLSALSYSRVMGANDRISIGLIGAGGRGHHALLQEMIAVRKQANADCVAVCDTWRQMREAAAATVTADHGRAPELYVDYEAVLARKDIDAVLIATPDHQHARMLTDAARAGKDAYVEKPLAMDMKELLLAVDTVRKYNRVVQMGTQIRSHPHSVSARQFVAEGKLGRIIKVEQSRNSLRPYWHRYAERPLSEGDVDWKRFLMHRKARPFDADQYAGWYGYREFSRGPHTNLMVHFIDLVHFVTGARTPSRVVTLGGTYRWKDKRTAPDSVETILEYPEGFLVRYSSAFGVPGGNYFHFYGERGFMNATRWSRTEYWPVSGDGIPDGERVPPGTRTPEVEVPSHMRNFLDCIRSRKETIAPIEAGYNHSVAVIMSDEAMIRGTRLVFDPARRVIQAG